jgi:hypothetical protein
MITQHRRSDDFIAFLHMLVDVLKIVHERSWPTLTDECRASASTGAGHYCRESISRTTRPGLPA